MKKLLSIVLLSTIIHVSAQEIKVEWGKEVPFDQVTFVPKIIGDFNNSFYAVQRVEQSFFSIMDYYLLKYNPDFTLVSKTHIIGKQEKEPEYVNIAYKDMYIINDKMMLFAGANEKKSGKAVIISQEFFTDGTPLGGFKTFDLLRTDAFDIRQSEDASRLLVVNYPETANEKIRFNIYDQKKVIVTCNDLILPVNGRAFDIREIKLTNQGDVFLLLKVYFNDNEKGKDGPHAFYKVVCIDPSGKISEYDSQPKDKKLVDIKLDLVGKAAICYGLYTDKEGKSAKDVKGAFVRKINVDSKKMEFSTQKDFSEAFIGQVISPKKAAQGHGIEGSYEVTNILIKPNGSLVLFLEDIYTYTMTSSSAGARPQYHYERKNIIATNISSDGNIKESTIIAKNQHTKNDFGEFASFFPTTWNDKVLIIYNDLPENIALRDPSKIKTLKSYKDAVAVQLLLNEDGTYEKKQLITSTEEDKPVISTKTFKKNSENEFVVFSRHKGKGKFGTLRLK